MKRYRSHKVVEAAPIRGWGAGSLPETLNIDLEDDAGIVLAPSSLFARGEPARGDYLVRYEPTDEDPGGYLSWSPKAVFEAGYWEILDNPYVPPGTRDEAIQRMREDGDADPKGTARMNYPALFGEAG